MIKIKVQTYDKDHQRPFDRIVGEIKKEDFSFMALKRIGIEEFSFKNDSITLICSTNKAYKFVREFE